MPNHAAAQDRPATASNAKKLIQAAALAAALVPLGSISAEGASITCNLNGSGTSDAECSFADIEGPFAGMTLYDFGDYKVGLSFSNVTASELDVTITDTPITQTDFDSRVEGDLGGYNCVTLVAPGDGDDGCRFFTIEPSVDDAWDSYELAFIWNLLTDDGEGGGTYPNGDDPEGATPGNIRILQAPGESTVFSIDMCLSAVDDPEAYAACEYFVSAVDPAIRSGNTAFSDFIVAAVAPVPEPGTIALLGTGLAGLLYRKRRARKP
jgi:hypothetical protein